MKEYVQYVMESDELLLLQFLKTRYNTVFVSIVHPITRIRFVAQEIIQIIMK
jgi:hypothetical protein